MKRPRKSKPVGVLAKTFRILRLVQSAPSPLVLKEISAQTGINKSTALRFLTDLEAEQFVSRDEKGAYRVGASFPTLGGRSNFQVALREMARPCLWELWRSTQETVNLAILDGLEVVYLDCLESSHNFRMVTNIGMRAVLYRTALGKAMLAFLPAEQREDILRSLTFQPFTPNTVTSAEQLRSELETIHQQGYAVDNEESVLGLRCVGAPILNAREEAVAAVSVSGPSTRITAQQVAGFGAQVSQAARDISARIAAHISSRGEVTE